MKTREMLKGAPISRWHRAMAHFCSDMHWDVDVNSQHLLYIYKCRCGFAVALRKVESMTRNNWGPFRNPMIESRRPSMVSDILNGLFVVYDEEPE